MLRLFSFEFLAWGRKLRVRPLPFWNRILLVLLLFLNLLVDRRDRQFRGAGQELGEGTRLSLLLLLRLFLAFLTHRSHFAYRRRRLGRDRYSFCVVIRWRHDWNGGVSIARREVHGEKPAERVGAALGPAFLLL